ncbi:Signal peptidase complex subunit 1 [Habropoda laboriosa]|uniref:Signal peptidase complex subunit 1 n=1 Tax=Habropoda laboriosa TaxID=597456 RepID=A0A0L7R856_9HYME|nr:Signal peptidase complex subunit 1 [Habropoda laboriosa]
MSSWIQKIKSIPMYMDYDGQARAEKLSTDIITLFGVVGLIWGYIIQQFSQTMYVLAAGFMMAALITVPSWAMYRSKPLDWQKPQSHCLLIDFNRARNTGRGHVFACARLPWFAPPRPRPRALSCAHGSSSSCEEDTRASRREGARPCSNSHPSRAKGARTSAGTPYRKSARTCSDCREGCCTYTHSRGEEMVVIGSAPFSGLLLFR